MKNLNIRSEMNNLSSTEKRNITLAPAPRRAFGIGWSAIVIPLISASLLHADPITSLEEVVPDASQKVVSFYNIGSRLDVRDNYRPPNYMVGMKNWAQFIKERIEPEYAWGVRRWALHNPFGAPTDGQPMIFDQFQAANSLGRSELTTDFVKAWSEFLRAHDDVELVVYLGKMRSVSTFDQNLPQRPDLYLERALDAVRPILQLREFGRVAIAFDASSGVAENHPVYHFMRLINSMGVPVYCEAWPHKDNIHLGEVGVTAAERFYQRAGLAATEHDGDQPDRHDRLPAESFKGEVAILVTANLANDPNLERDPAALIKLIREIVLDRGMSVFAPVRVLMGENNES